jgi:hypothetical protein
MGFSTGRVEDRDEGEGPCREHFALWWEAGEGLGKKRSFLGGPGRRELTCEPQPPADDFCAGRFLGGSQLF